MSVYSLHIAVYMHTVDKAHISQAVLANVGCDVCEAKALADPVSNATLQQAWPERQHTHLGGNACCSER
jgi:hypothetical protein